MNAQTAEIIYAARFPGMPGFGAVVADDGEPKWRKEVAKTLADWIKRGATVEQTTREAAAAGMREYMDARQAAEKQAAATQHDLFGEAA